MYIFDLVSGVRCLQHYYGYPTYISSEIVNQWDATFPAITVCALETPYNEEVLRSHGIQVGDPEFVESVDFFLFEVTWHRHPKTDLMLAANQF